MVFVCRDLLQAPIQLILDKPTLAMQLCISLTRPYGDIRTLLHVYFSVYLSFVFLWLQASSI